MSDCKTIPFTMTATAEQCEKLIQWTGCVNAFPFHGHERGTLQLGGCSATPEAPGTFRVEGMFRQRPEGFAAGVVLDTETGATHVVGEPDHVDFAQLPFVLMEPTLS